MRRNIVIFALIISFFGNCQSIQKKGSSKAQNKTEDILSLKDSVTIKNKNSENITKIYLKSTEKKTDYFNYIFPIITLLLGIGINRFIDFRNDRKKIKKSGKRWLSELRVLKKPIEKQIENIDTFLIEHNNQEKYTFPRPELVSTLDCEVFITLDKSELVEFLEKFKNNKFHEAVENSSEINSFITILKSTYDNFRRVFEEYKQNVSLHTTSVSRNLQAFMKEFGIYGVLLEQELNDEPINDPRYRPILDLMDSEIAPYLDNSNYDLYKLEKDFFKPLIYILSGLRLDERTYPMLENARNCVTEIKAIRMEKHYLNINFKNIKDSYLESKDWLPDVIKTIE